MIRQSKINKWDDYLSPFIPFFLFFVHRGWETGTFFIYDPRITGGDLSSNSSKKMKFWELVGFVVAVAALCCCCCLLAGVAVWRIGQCATSTLKMAP